MTERPTILYPIQVLEGESIPEGVPALLANAHVVLLGYHVVPDQTATDQARMQFEERARARMDQFEEMLTNAGATVECPLVFTHKAQPTIDRMIYEHDSMAVLVPHATRPPEDVLVATRGTVGVDRLLRTVSGLFADTDVDVTLFHVLEDGESAEDARTLLDGIADRLAESGVSENAIDIRVSEAEDSLDALVEAAEPFDAVVVGETDPSIVTYLFGMVGDQIADRFLEPVLVIQRERPEDAEREQTEAEIVEPRRSED